jgi:formamidopyrimidine-DNA glycosylase
VPELPEVETIVRALAPRLQGRRIRAAELLAPLVLRHWPNASGDQIINQRIRRVERHGKHIVITLEEGVLVIHLGMTGKLLFDAPRTPHTRAIFLLDDAELLYEDIRMFGSIEFHKALPPRMSALGPEPFDIAPDQFFERMQASRTSIKALLLGQKVMRGLGNIYVDEALFRAHILPKRQANRIGRGRADHLHQSILEVLTDAIEHRGSSISDYVDADGIRGGFQLRHQVYGKEGAPCPACGTPIRRTVVAQRGTHYCVRCQR